MKSGLFLAVFLWIIVIFSGLANFFGWYKAYDGLDWVMHFLGGVWVAAASMYFYQRQGWKRPSLFHILLWVFLIALAWEIYEFIGDRFLDKPLFQQSSWDTVGDTVFALLGAIISHLFIKRK